MCHCASTYVGWVCPPGYSVSSGRSFISVSYWRRCHPRHEVWSQIHGAGRGSRGWPGLQRKGWWAKGRRHGPGTRGSQPQLSAAYPQMWTSAMCSLTCVPMVSASTASAPSAATARMGTRQMPLPHPAWVSPLIPIPCPSPAPLHSIWPALL